MLITGIPSANSQHDAGVCLEEHALADRILFNTVFDQFLLRQFGLVEWYTTEIR
jgi:hypothetical protein